MLKILQKHHQITSKRVAVVNISQKVNQKSAPSSTPTIHALGEFRTATGTARGEDDDVSILQRKGHETMDVILTLAHQMDHRRRSQGTSGGGGLQRVRTRLHGVGEGGGMEKCFTYGSERG